MNHELVSSDELREMIEKLVMGLRRSCPHECRIYGFEPITTEEKDNLVEAGEDMMDRYDGEWEAA